MNDVEEWRDIEGYEGSYQVSSHGRVRSLDRVEINKNGVRRQLKGKILKSVVLKSGYLKVALGGGYHILVSRLVCEVFNGPPPFSDYQCDHIDSNPKNNHFSNLQWLSSEDHKAKTKVGQANPISLEYIKTGEEFSFDSYCDAEKGLGVHRGSLHKLVSGEYSQTSGYRLAPSKD